MKRTKCLFAILLSVIILVCAGSPFTSINSAAKASNTSKKSITLNYSQYTLKKGQSVKFKAKVSPKKAKVNWKSSNTKVATVDNKGKVKAIKSGKATITASLAGTKKKAKIKLIVGTPIKTITLTETEKELKVGDEYTITPNISPKNASNKDISYESSDSSIATVDNTGKVKAIKEGTASIKASSTDGSKKSATLTIKVVAKEDASKENTVIKVSSITISVVGDSEYLHVEGPTSLQLTVTVLPENATDKSVTWSSNDNSVASVNANGLVTAAGEGDVTITATANDGSGIKAEKNLHVNDGE